MSVVRDLGLAACPACQQEYKHADCARRDQAARHVVPALQTLHSVLFAAIRTAKNKFYKERRRAHTGPDTHPGIPLSLDLCDYIICGLERLIASCSRDLKWFVPMAPNDLGFILHFKTVETVFHRVVQGILIS